ncbi:baseplate J/gp47 family protein [Moorena producens]|uniref:baseplate J/gp47 family protein n=1 Tax=Moorena producens TaxID=1155739 RepID=UPI003C72D988
MPLQLPNLDDKTYDDLVAEAISLIPTYAPQWTNHNPSDPGITLIELFAYLTEMLLYRQNRVTEANIIMFLKLLNGENWQHNPKKDLQTEIKEAINQVRDRYRAITCADFVELALEADDTVARAHCLPRRNLNSENPLGEPVDKPGHVSIIIIPHSQDSNNSTPQPSQELINKVKDYLEQRRLITTKIHVVRPRYLTISIRLTIHLNREAEAADLLKDVTDKLENFFCPLPNPEHPQGWPFGRNVYVSELYQLLDELEAVDYVTKTNQEYEVFLPNLDSDLGNQQRLVYTDTGQLSAIQLKPEELVNLTITASDIEIISPLKPVDSTG